MKTLISSLIAAALFAAASCAQHDHAAPQATGLPDDAAAWMADLAILDDRIRTLHPRGDSVRFLSQWETALAATREVVPGMIVAQRLAAFSRLMAELEDGHTNLVPFFIPVAGFERQLPLRFYQFEEGLFVTSTSDALSDLAGARVNAVGGRPIDDAFAEAMSWVGADNPQWQRNWAAILLRYAIYLEALEAAGPQGAELNLTLSTGERHTVRIAFEIDPETPVSARHADSIRYSTDRNFDFTYLPRYNAVYAIYNAVADEDDESVAQFAERLFAFIEARQVDRLIFDIRENGGGNNYLNQPLLHGMIASRLNRPGGIVILTGRATFSAAMNFATRAERHTQALFVGEPTGGAPNHYGDPIVEMLPNTGLPLLVSTLFWQDSAPDDSRQWIVPDMPVTERFSDWAAGVDAPLEAALVFNASDLPSELPGLRWQRASQQ
jgi:hypothetical protein